MCQTVASTPALKIVKFIYHIVQNFDEGNFDIFDAFQLDRQYFNLSNCLAFTSVYIVKDCDHLSKYFPSNIWRVSIRQNFPPPFKILRYMVFQYYKTYLSFRSRIISSFDGEIFSSFICTARLITLSCNINNKDWKLCMFLYINTTS